MAPYARQSRTVFPPSESGYDDEGLFEWFIDACNQTKCIYLARRNGHRVWKLTTPKYNLEVWMHSNAGNENAVAALCYLSVTSNGNVLILKFERQEGQIPPVAHRLESYTNDAVLIHRINLDVPLNIIKPESCSFLEMSPGNFAINFQNALLLKSVNYDTLTTTDLNRFLKIYHGPIALYSVNRLIAVVNGKLTMIDSRLIAENISNSVTVYAKTLHYRVDRRQLVVFLSAMNSVQIYTLEYEGEDFMADNV